MTSLNFSLKELLSFGWSKTKQHFWFIVLTFIIVSIINGATRHIPILDGVVGLMTGISLASVSLAIVRDHHFTFESLFTPLLSMKRVLKYLALSIILSLPVMLAFNLVIYSAMIKSVPLGVLGIIMILFAIFIAIRFVFFSFIVIENENSKIKDLFKMSYKITSKGTLKIFAFFFILVLVNIIGVLPAMLGLIITIPVSMFATAKLYDIYKDHNLHNH